VILLKEINVLSLIIDLDDGRDKIRKIFFLEENSIIIILNNMLYFVLYRMFTLQTKFGIA
jgi:hypothetical protein